MTSDALPGADIDHFRTFGFVVLRAAIDPVPLADELDAALREGHRSSFAVDVAGGISGCYVPMMCERTPLSLALLHRFAGPASQLLGGAVLPVRAKGVRYAASTGWHRDSEHPLPSIGFVAYLEPLRAATGALRVLPGTHRDDLAGAVAAYLAAWQPDTGQLPAWSAETDPGDVIVFDEHLFHASLGGHERRQWRVDYVADPVADPATDPATDPLADLADQEEAKGRVRAYFAAIYPPDWDGGYDVDRFPSYGPHWQATAGRWADRLRRLGAEDAAAAEEAFARSRQR